MTRAVRSKICRPNTLEFEKPIADLEKKIEELTLFTSNGNIDLEEEILKLHKKADQLRAEIYSRLTPWQKAQISRHPNRPYTLDYIEAMLTDFTEMHGDRAYADDSAIVCGMARLDGMPVVVIGHQKGRTTKEKISRNFGMPNPEGYRKALRIMEFARKVQKATHHLHRYSRRLSRHRCRRARSGRIHCPESLCHVQSQGADRNDRDRRRRKRRRAGARRC